MSENNDNVGDLFAPALPYFSFKAKGDKAVGKIVKMTRRNVTDPDTGEVKKFKDGNAMPEVVFVLTNEQYPEGCNLFARGAMLSAIRTAVRASGSGPDLGGMLAVVHHDEKPATSPTRSATRLFQAQYKAPTEPYVAPETKAAVEEVKAATPAEAAEASGADAAALASLFDN